MLISSRNFFNGYRDYIIELYLFTTFILVSKYVNLIRAKSAFAETSKNTWNLNTNFDLVQNLFALLYYTTTYHVCQ